MTPRNADSGDTQRVVRKRTVQQHRPTPNSENDEIRDDAATGLTAEHLARLSLAEKQDLYKRLRSAAARAALQPSMQAALTLRETSCVYKDIDLSGLVDALTEQTEAAINGDLSRAEAMLAAQSHTLDTIFNSFARFAANADQLDTAERYLKLALRAQVQCRETWQALTALKNPPAVNYVRQANIAHGPQQVNNGPASGADSSPPSAASIVKSKLLEVTDGERLDSGAARAPEQTDPEMATVGQIDGPKIG